MNPTFIESNFEKRQSKVLQEEALEQWETDWMKRTVEPIEEKVNVLAGFARGVLSKGDLVKVVQKLRDAGVANLSPELYKNLLLKAERDMQELAKHIDTLMQAINKASA
jgi:peptide subunit release factor RF-3